jgi:hypothetical protein
MPADTGALIEKLNTHCQARRRSGGAAAVLQQQQQAVLR